MPRATPAFPLIRRAGPDDRAALVGMRLKLWPAEPNEEDEELARLLPRADFAAFLALAGAEPVGFAEATVRGYADGVATDRPAAYLEAMWVARRWRRRGIAAALLDATIAWARAQGCGGMGSDALLANRVSHRWHRAMGFAEVDRVVAFARAI